MGGRGRGARRPGNQPGDGHKGKDTGLPAGFSLDSAFLREDEAESCLLALSAETHWESHHFLIFGRSVPMPRRIAWFGEHTYGYSGVVHPARPLPARIASLRDRVARACGHPFNCVLLNLYRDGKDSMGWHADDDYDAGAHSGVASISLGATRRFRLRSRDAARRSVGLDLGPGSLLFMEPGTQSAWQHALPRTARAIGPRLNLTFRHLVADNVRG